jgi:hypothetical protein
MKSILRWHNLLILTFAFVFIQCSDKESNNIVGPDYTPPPLTNSTWEMISNPESVGWSTAKLREAYGFSQDIQTAAVMIIYQGKVLYHWGDLSRKYWVHSCRKSFMSALYGIHVDEGNIDLTKTMGELGIILLHCQTRKKPQRCECCSRPDPACTIQQRLKRLR